MKQAALPLSLNVKKTRKAEFLQLRISGHGGQRFSLKADTISS
jgi:hypothetical protein